MTGLKQGQFVAKLAQYSTSMKEAGYNTEGVKQFASLTGGLAQAGMKGERAFTVGQTLNEDVRKGVGGGVMSKLALAKLMSSGKGDYFEMSQLMEEEGLGNKDVREAYGESLDMFDPKIRGQIMKGQATRKESGLLTGNALQSKITEDTSGVKAGGSSALAIENARMSMITQKGGIGEKSAKLSHTMAADSLALFEQLNKNKTLDKVVDARKPTPEQRQKQKLIVAFQMLYLGSPMFFYGDEAGMWGANDPDCRKPMVWSEKKYDAETFNPDQSKHSPDEVIFDQDLFDWYRKFIGLRQQYKSIKLGSYSTLTTDDEKKLYAFSRKLGNEEVIVIVNRSDKSLLFTHPELSKQKYKNLFTHLSVVKQINVNAMDVVVLGNK